MTESLNPKVAAGKARDTYRKTAAQFEELVHDTQLPEAMRALAEKNIAQTRELYERSEGSELGRPGISSLIDPNEADLARL